MISLITILLLGHFYSLHEAFSVCPNRPSRLTRISKNINLETTTTDLLTEQELKQDDYQQTHNSGQFLILDEMGSIRTGDGSNVLLKGLDPSVWSATRPSSGETSALFLHTFHANEQVEHQTTLGNLNSCRRLLACSRKL